MVKRLKEKIVIYRFEDSYHSSDDSDYEPPEGSDSNSSSDSSVSADSDTSGETLPSDAGDSVYKSEL